MNTLQHAKQLQDRTKKFAVRIIKAFARLPKRTKQLESSDANFFDREPRLLPII